MSTTLSQELQPPPIAGWNLALRFGLEVGALVALGIAAFRLTPGPLRWFAAIAVPVGAAVVWGVFNVPGDPSRSGAAPVVVDGRIRLLVELAVLVAGAVAIVLAGQPAAAGVYLALVVVQYATSIDRVRWLVES